MNSSAHSAWPFAVRPLTPKLGAEISGVTLADDISDELFRALYAAWLRYQVLLFPPQDLPPERRSADHLPYGVDTIVLRIEWPTVPASRGHNGRA